MVVKGKAGVFDGTIRLSGWGYCDPEKTTSLWKQRLGNLKSRC